MSTVFVCVITVEIYIPMSHSLKDKRKQIKSLKDKIQNRFNVSIAEIAKHEDWQHGVLGMTMIGNDKRYLESQYSAIENLVLDYRDVELLEINLEWV